MTNHGIRTDETHRKGTIGGLAGLLLWASIAAAVVAFAVVLALSALPQNGAIAQRTVQPPLTVEKQASPRPAETASRSSADPRVFEGTKATDLDEPNGPIFGPPERKRTVAEQTIESLLGSPNSPSDNTAIKAALTNARAGRMAQALKQANEISAPAAKKLIQWSVYRTFGSGVRAETIEAFRTKNTNWPENALLRQRAEEALLLSNASTSDIRTFFQSSEPQFPAGHAALARTEIEDGKTETARQRISTAWRTGTFNATIENKIAALFFPLLSEADHKWRLDRFLLDDDRYGRPQRLTIIRRMIKRLGPKEAAKARARLLVWRSYGRRGRRARIAAAARAFAEIDKQRTAKKVALPVRKTDPANIEGKEPSTAEKKSARIEETALIEKSDEKNEDWPFEYHRIQMLRRQGKDGEAWRRLIQAPTATDLIVSPDEWWVERRTNAYNALYKNSPRTAYRLVARFANLGVNARNEALFMAGWIALRKLGDPDAARRHFEDFTQSADGPRTRSQSHYWLARTLQELQDDEGAKTNFKLAARQFNTFYGQLARQELDPALRELQVPEPPELTDEKITDFTSRQTIQALKLAHASGDSVTTRRLLRALRKSVKDEHVLRLLAEFAKTIGDTQMSVRIGKTGLFYGHNLGAYAYPTHAFPNFEPLTTPPEPAMLYGLARQESEFNTLITSIAGARGVLQVMQVTARHVCRSYRLRCGSRAALQRRLSADPSYNARLASAYISDRMREFGGSYILTYAGYNAGPGRARYWIGKNGDPRHPKIDPIDWIESIHIKETRDYVKKVMANLQVYRARLGNPKTALQITSDINRGSL